MSEFVTKSVAQEQQEQRIESTHSRGHVSAALPWLRQPWQCSPSSAPRPFSRRAKTSKDKYSLVSPGGIAFSDFRGYEDWADVSSARTDEILKVIVAQSDHDQGVSRPAFRATASLSRMAP